MIIQKRRSLLFFCLFAGVSSCRIDQLDWGAEGGDAAAGHQCLFSRNTCFDYFGTLPGLAVLAPASVL